MVSVDRYCQMTRHKRTWEGYQENGKDRANITEVIE